MDSIQMAILREGSNMYLLRIEDTVEAGFFIIKKWYVARARTEAKVADQVCILCWGKVPFVFREKNIGRFCVDLCW